jgi:hypothetical protein
LPSRAYANGLGENYGWQFQNGADRANRAFIEDMRQKRNSGFYSAPVYNTTIDRQYNCNVASTATGNTGTNTTQAAMPSTGGNSGNAVGNQSQKYLDLASRAGTTTVADSQLSNGEVQTSVRGNVSSNVSDNTTSQALNSDQQNTGNQTASVDGSTACSFGVLN